MTEVTQCSSIRNVRYREPAVTNTMTNVGAKRTLGTATSLLNQRQNSQKYLEPFVSGEAAFLFVRIPKVTINELTRALVRLCALR